MTHARRAFAEITGLIGLLSQVTQVDMTPRQKEGLKGAEACVMLAAHPGKLDINELDALAQAGLIFGAVLAGER